MKPEIKIEVEMKIEAKDEIKPEAKIDEKSEVVTYSHYKKARDEFTKTEKPSADVVKTDILMWRPVYICKGNITYVKPCEIDEADCRFEFTYGTAYIWTKWRDCTQWRDALLWLQSSEPKEMFNLRMSWWSRAIEFVLQSHKISISTFCDPEDQFDMSIQIPYHKAVHALADACLFAIKNTPDVATPVATHAHTFDADTKVDVDIKTDADIKFETKDEDSKNEAELGAEAGSEVKVGAGDEIEDDAASDDGSDDASDDGSDEKMEPVQESSMCVLS